MLNKVMLIGRLGQDPEIKHISADSSVANFTVATNEYGGKDESGKRIELTEWHKISVWRKGLVEVIEKYLKKGHLVYLEGKIRTRSWEDKEGTKRYTTEIIVDEMRMLEKAGDNNSGNEQYTAHSAPQNAAASSAVADNGQDTADDLPF